MQRPAMILFDYGRTLLHEPGHDPAGGSSALFDHILHNPRGVTREAFAQQMTDLFAAAKRSRDPLCEVNEQEFLRRAMAEMEITLAVSYPEAEEIVMNGISMGAVMPHAGEMLAALDRMGIQTGVVSNNCFSGAALRRRFDRLLPGNRLAFILSSCDQVWKKPHPAMFREALRRTGLQATQVWHCGDSIAADVMGAQSAGIFPVLYEGETPGAPNPFPHQNDGLTMDFPHLHLHDWRELPALLARMD